MKYRELKGEEIIKRGDEVKFSDGLPWEKAKGCIGVAVESVLIVGYARRPIKSARTLHNKPRVLGAKKRPPRVTTR
jgi:hypothetical protein